jgi:hypothetical protein
MLAAVWIVCKVCCRTFSSWQVGNFASVTGKVLAGPGFSRRVDRIAQGPMPVRWPGRVIFLLAVDHLKRLVDAIAYLLEKLGLHGYTLFLESGRQES